MPGNDLQQIAANAQTFLAVSTCETNAQNLCKCSKHFPNLLENIKCTFHLYAVNTTILPVHFVCGGENEKNAANKANGTNTGDLPLFRSFVRTLFAE